jgi:serine/threonine protein kinase
MYSLGATYYYMLYGKIPSKDKLEFPEHIPISSEAKNFMMKSLNVQPELRPELHEIENLSLL